MSSMSFEYDDVRAEQQTEISLSVRKKVSIVWSYFEKLDRLRVRCRLCRHEQNYQGTTGNILRHLKNKHNIDATLKGRKENPELTTKLNHVLENVDKPDIPEEDCEIVFLKNGIPDTTRRQPNTRKDKKTICDEILDPYTDSTFQLYNYPEERAYKHNPRNSTDKQKFSAEEDRIMAEIEYFREKAGYYRMQKNLIALQARKIKYELENS